MENEIHQFLAAYFAEHGLSRTHENVRYVEHSFIDEDVDTEIVNILSGKKHAVCRVSAWLGEQKLAPLEKGGILVLADTFGKVFAVVMIEEIETVRYMDVTEKMTNAFALGDGSLEVWQNLSHEAFNDECNFLKIDFDQETELLVTWFEVIFPIDK